MQCTRKIIKFSPTNNVDLKNKYIMPETESQPVYIANESNTCMVKSKLTFNE